MTENRVRNGLYASVNGTQMYYEIHGTGKPLVLIHGGLGSVEMFGEILPSLAEGRQVIGIDLQAHGGTADVDRPLRFESMADDVAALIEELGLGPVDLMGYSLGGGVALQTAIRHPETVRRMAIISAPFRRDGWYPEVLAGMAAMNAEAARAMVGSPPHAAYVSVAPKPEDWPVLVGKTGDLLRQDYDWTAGVAAIEAPTLLVFGDADAVQLGHVVEMYRLLGGGPAILSPGGTMGDLPDSQLAVLPGTTHYEILSSPGLVPAVVSFLDAPASQGRKAIAA